ncbi:hypothetical protein [Dyadobacter alkalitolerans]|uniref:hypothetical protein n=1 Tax=Dyadobacter alkalitolerans TaxID=492736 RepID=UPI00047B81AC|nr:hypothetical protein [Dyadobacter alkalitolerans]
MTNVSILTCSDRFVDNANTSSTFYAVYDCRMTNNVPSQNVAFIEQRLGTENTEQGASDEKYFRSLSQAKAYVKSHFNSGAEYFSVKQSMNPDNIMHAITDKIAYPMA